MTEHFECDPDNPKDYLTEYRSSRLAQALRDQHYLGFIRGMLFAAIAAGIGFIIGTYLI